MGNKELDAIRDGISQTEEVIILKYPQDCPVEFIPYVFAKFKRSLRHGNDYFSLMDQESFSKAYDEYISSLIARSVLRLAHLKSDMDNLLGFSIVEGSTLHYVFVQAEFRRIGIGKLLVPEKIERLTHLTKMGMMLWSSKLPEAKFSPFY